MAILHQTRPSPRSLAPNPVAGPLTGMAPALRANRETSQRLRRIFDHVASRRCVLFFDELDTVGKERGDTHETGEIKRVVSA